LLICASSGEELSACSREFVRGMRRDGARTEFHTPCDPESLLQATNRLLAEVPLDPSLADAARTPPHILVIDEAESLADAETAALRRIVRGLRGSCFRVVMLVKGPRTALQGMPLSELMDLVMVWETDSPEVVDARGEAGSSPSAVPDHPDDGLPYADLPEPVRPIPDVLAELARERAEMRGFDVTAPGRWRASPTMIVIAVMGCLLAGFAMNGGLTGGATPGPVAYDCGLHPDRESVDVLLARIDRATPTRVTAESGRLRLRVGPFSSGPAAQAARAQVWPLGACRIEPTAFETAIEPDRRSGG
jgi:hypothetical protein